MKKSLFLLLFALISGSTGLHSNGASSLVRSSSGLSNFFNSAVGWVKGSSDLANSPNSLNESSSRSVGSANGSSKKDYRLVEITFTWNDIESLLCWKDSSKDSTNPSKNSATAVLYSCKKDASGNIIRKKAMAEKGEPVEYLRRLYYLLPVSLLLNRHNVPSMHRLSSSAHRLPSMHLLSSSMHHVPKNVYLFGILVPIMMGTYAYSLYSPDAEKNDIAAKENVKIGSAANENSQSKKIEDCLAKGRAYLLEQKKALAEKKDDLLSFLPSIRS